MSVPPAKARVVPVGWAARRSRNARRARSAGRQLLGTLAVVFAVITVTFLVTRVFAPDPVSLFLGTGGNGYVNAHQEAVARAAVEKKLGLDKSIPQQFYQFVVDLVHGNLGTSFQTGQPVTKDLEARLPATAELAVYALIFGIILGVGAGMISALRREGAVDQGVRFLTIGAIALPQFWIGLMLLWLCYERLRIAPGPVGRLPIGQAPPPHVTGFYVPDSLLAGQWPKAAEPAWQLVLPVFVLGIGLAAPICRIVRQSMVEALTSDYVRTATAMGIGRRRITLVYALKNALLPVVTILAGIFAFTFVGSILVEGIFGWPGVGNYALQSIQTSDFPAIQGFVLYATLLYVFIYSMLEYVYSYVDPRIRK
jgi:peptide/nickel transport system permease protein